METFVRLSMIVFTMIVFLNIGLTAIDMNEKRIGSGLEVFPSDANVGYSEALTQQTIKEETGTKMALPSTLQVSSNPLNILGQVMDGVIWIINSFLYFVGLMVTSSTAYHNVLMQISNSLGGAENKAIEYLFLSISGTIAIVCFFGFIGIIKTIADVVKR